MNKQQQQLIITFLLLIILIPIMVVDSAPSSSSSSSPSSCDCNEVIQDRDKAKALKFKLIAMSTILIASVLGVSLPILGNKIPTLNPQNDVFFMIKAFAAGVILATGFVHILPDAFDSLTSPCLKENPWGKFPFAGFVAMFSSIATMMIDTFATSYYQKTHFNDKVALPSLKQDHDHHSDIQIDHNVFHHDDYVHVHTHATHGHAHGSAFVSSDQDFSSSDHVRHRIISQVLELGIVVHSVIIGVSLGASQSPNVVKYLVTALTFHQFFEGMGLGGCISQAKFKSKAIVIMVLFFSLTTTTGIGIGMGISSIYNENSPTALIVEGVFNSASAGILIYMALVDLIAADFMNPRMQSNLRLLLAANLSLLLGAGCMSLLAKWA